MIPYIVADDKAFKKLDTAINSIPEILAGVVEFAVSEASDPALSALQATPRPSVHPFIWSLNPEKQRRAQRYYFAAIARGEIPTDGTRYRRSGRYGKSFDAGVKETKDSVDAVLGSDFDKASYVAGNEDGSIKQIPGHVKTGWQAFRPIATSWADDVVQVVQRELPGAIQRKV
ncbi:MAG: hypothetical protein ACPG7F_15805 [Aggregatilineales bacterium]